ncbi:MAG: hypothetical protein MJB14_14570 [Spirochaetes bacterium]|nr:hypothetical protein [Spirochaetota bacterium]
MKKKILILLIVLLLPISIFTATIDKVIKSETAIVITWQDSEGKWLASGPIQTTPIGMETEEEALYYVYVDRLDTLNLVGFFKKYTVYSLNRNKVDFEEDPRTIITQKRLAKK